jgi:hypothetical protein
VIDSRGQSTDGGLASARICQSLVEGKVPLQTGLPGRDRQRHDTSRARRGEESCASVGVVIVGDTFDAASMVPSGGK